MQEVSLITNNQVDIIIASQNTGSALLKCIDNLMLLENLGEIIVINNGSSQNRQNIGELNF
jgi:hypothetical protein